MEKFTGPCDNYKVHWYFDKAYGGCARFWYGGCEGNDNRFETKEECHNACVSPKGLLGMRVLSFFNMVMNFFIKF